MTTNRDSIQLPPWWMAATCFTVLAAFTLYLSACSADRSDYWHNTSQARGAIQRGPTDAAGASAYQRLYGPAAARRTR